MADNLFVIWRDWVVPGGGPVDLNSTIWGSQNSGSGWSAKVPLYNVPLPHTGFTTPIAALTISYPSTGFALDVEIGFTGIGPSWFPPSGSNIFPPTQIIDHTNKPEIGNLTFDSKVLLFDFGGSAYYFSVSDTTNNLVVYKRSGITWTPQDTANEPFFGNGTGGTATYDAVTNQVLLAYARASDNALILQEFDVASGLFTAPHDPDPSIILDINQVQVIWVFKFPNGDTGVIIRNETTPALELFILVSAVWTNAGVFFIGDTLALFAGLAVDATGRVHLFFGPHPTVSTVMHYRNYFSGSFSTTFTFPGTAMIDGANWGFGHIVIKNGDTLCVPFLGALGPAAAIVPCIFYGTPLSAPSWSAPELIDNDASDAASGITLSILTAGPSPPSLACPTSIANLNAPYSDSFVASGGTPPYTFAIIAGALPPGLSLNPATGLISGTPTATGPFAYTGQVTDSFGVTATANCSITVAPSPITIRCPQASTAIVNLPYSSPVLANLGVPPYTFAIFAGALPPGLTLDSGTGIVSGTPTVTGTYTFTIQVTDSLGSITRQVCIIVIQNCPQVDSPTIFK